MKPETMMLAVSIAGWILNLGATAVAVGIAYGKLAGQHTAMAKEMAAVRKMLGNGEPGVFLRTDRADELIRESREQRQRVQAIADDHETRLRTLESPAREA